MDAISSIEPMLPIDGDIVPLLELAGDLRTEAAKLMPQIGPAARSSLAKILRAMNSYYSNKIEGQHTYPADLEAALQNNFSSNIEVKRRQELALAHIAVEEEFEQITKTLEWKDHFSKEWICRIHQSLYSRLDPESLAILDEQGNRRGEMAPGLIRDGWVKVGDHEAPDPEHLDALMRHFAFRYGGKVYSESMKLIVAGASLHRLSWIHPFPDGNGRVSRLQNHFILHYMGLTEGLWSPMRGLARRQGDYYATLHEADLPRRHDADGRGSLSSSGLAKFIEFWLQVCLDQIKFMAQLLSLETMQTRYVSLSLQFLHDYGRGAVLHHRSKLRPDLLGRALHRLFVEGRIERGEFKSMLDTSDRTASRVISSLLEQRLVVSSSRTGHLEPGFPLFSFRFLFPGLWPEAEGVMSPTPQPSQ
jgi:Fic family protein